jgi:hypothetical protein
MTPVFRFLQRSSRALVVCSLLLASQAFVVSAPRSSASDTHCTSLRKWAHAFENTSLTLDQIARFDRPHRLAIFSAVTPSVRASLWREQLRRFESQSDLSDTQRALVAEGRTLITPALYERAPAAMHAYQTFWSRAAESFGSTEQRRAWSDLGAVAGAVSAAAKPPKGKSSSAEWCQCSPASGQFDCGGGSCFPADCQGFGGCGSSGTNYCSGFCG